jgi:acyl-CoA reductase-like NAD-dependent aldehyde dehydrogenase
MEMAESVVSFTGSEKVGKEVGKVVQDRFGKVSYMNHAR